jgi:hypothetical protein
MSKLWKFQQLSGWEQRLFLQSLVLLPLTALGLRWFGLKRFQKFLSRRLPVQPPSPTDDDLTRSARIAQTVDRAARNGAYRANCLQRSFMLWWLLRLRGIDSQLRIGVRKSSQRFEAHAWLEYDGVVLNDKANVADRFSVFAEDVLGAVLI